MKLTIFTATGDVGRQLLEQAIAAAHDGSAAARNPARLTRQVRTCTADLAAADPDALEPAADGADAVLSGLCPHSSARDGIAAPGTASVAAVMQAAGLQRVSQPVTASGLESAPAPAGLNP
jgi:putative NADH-flavin reductase